MKIALAQMNPRMGDYGFNSDKMLAMTNQAVAARAKLVVFSEMCLFGYPAYDLLERAEEIEKQTKELHRFLKKIPSGITVVFGAVIHNSRKTGKAYQNVAVVGIKGRKPLFTAKQLLPSYDVFDDVRFFEPGNKTLITRINGIGKVAVTVCEDMWAGPQNYSYDPFKKIKGVNLIINLSASPYDPHKNKLRMSVARNHVKKIKAPFVYVNQVAGQDELIFDGQSFVLDKSGKLVQKLSPFNEEMRFIDLKSAKPIKDVTLIAAEEVKSALVLGLRNFVSKTGQKRVHLGLSGGIDSSLVACLAVDALGKNNVVGLMLPGPFNSEGSVTDSEKLAHDLGIQTEKISINEYYKLGLGTLESLGPKNSIAEQNLQSRLRGLILMMYSNIHQSILLSTANKSELATGYSTLYGDTCGGLMPIGDLTKNQVYEISKLYSAIPQTVLDKAPSAELAPNQKDQDSLPPYAILDRAVDNIITHRKKPSGEIENWLLNKLLISEFKRWQSPPILRVSAHAFGRGRRMPISKKL